MTATHPGTPRRVVGLAVVALLAPLFVLVLPGPADALTVDVTTTADGGPGSLRQAVDDINAAGAGPHVINLGTDQVYRLTDCAGGYLETDVGPVTVNGNGSTIEQTCAGQRIWRHNPAALLTFNSVTITGGDRSGNAGGIKTFGDLTLNDSTIAGNRADGNGGGVWIQDATLTINRSTFERNRADDDENSEGDGGGFYSDTGTVIVDNSTFTENYAWRGGGLNGNFMDVTYSTIVGNETGGVGSNVVDRGIMTVFATVIADPLGFAENCANDGMDSLGYNWADDTSCSFDDPTDVEDPGGDPELGALADNGGPTETMLPADTSPLVDAIPSSDPDCTGTDQRGVTRPQFDGCDIGSVELSPEPPPETTTTTTTPAGVVTPNAATAAEAVATQPTFTG